MDPVSAIGLAASSLQLASFAFTAALRSIRLVKDLKDVPARLRICLADAENSIQRLCDLQSMLADPTSKLYSVVSQDQILRLKTVVQDGQDATEALHKKLESIFPAQVATSGRDRIKAAWKNVVSLGMEKEVEDSIRRIQRLNDEVSRELQVINLESHAVLREHINSTTHNEHEVTRAELRSLRDAVLPIMTGQSQAMSTTEQAVAVRLSETDKSDLARHLCEALMSHPSALRDSCDNTTSLAAKSRRGLGPLAWASSNSTCACFKKRISSAHRLIPGIGLEYEAQANHSPGCPLASYATQSWSYTVSVTLLPLINKTVALTFGAKRHGGGWSISPALRYYATVRRAESPLFRAFDEVMRHRELPEMMRQLARPPGIGKLRFRGLVLRAMFVRIKQCLLDMMASRTGSLTDKDEGNHTLLHEIAGLIYRANFDAGPLQAVPEIREMLQLAALAGVDAGAKALTHKGRYPYPGRAHQHDGYTASDMVMMCVKNEETWDLVGPDYFGNLGMEYNRATFVGTADNGYLGHRFYARFGELIDGLGPLGSAVLQRSLHQLKAKLHDPSFSIRGYGREPSRCIMYLATPWHDGLRLLLQAGFDPYHSVEEAFRQNDLGALQIALEYSGWEPVDALYWAVSSTDSLQQCLVDTIRRRRDDLLHLCYQYMTGPELAELRLPGQTPIDSDIEQVTRILETKNLPKEVDSRYKYTIGRHVYTACVRLTWALESNRSSSLLDMLYTAGFRDIDGQRVFARLLWDLSVPSARKTEHVWTVLNWLVEKAVTPFRSLVAYWPTVIFDLAIAYGRLFLFARQELSKGAGMLKALAKFRGATQRDTCECFCSMGGCFPSRLFLTRKWGEDIPSLTTYRTARSLRDRMLRDWCQLCSMDDKSTAVHFEDAVRLEVFDRLGMMHTCCKLVEDCDKGPGWFLEEATIWQLGAWCPTEDERKEVQDEQAELHEQLELIMEAYRGYAQRKGGPSEDMLKDWWRILGGMLPSPIDDYGYYHEDDSDEDAEAQHIGVFTDDELHDRRAAREREVLVRNGYRDLDFVEVIRLHFREYLDEGDETTGHGNERKDQLPYMDGEPQCGPSTLLPQSRSQNKAKRRNSF